MSPNGSIATVTPSSVRRKADCPYHSTCMCSSSSAVPAGVGAGARRLARPRRALCPPRISDAAAATRQATIANANASCRPSRNGAEMSVREERVAGEHGLVVRRAAPASTWAPTQVLDRVVAEEGGEQDRDRRQLRRRACAVAGRHAVRLAARRVIVCGSVAVSPTIISVKKMPIDSTCAEFWNVWFIAPPAPRSPGGRLFITAARLGEANIPIEAPIEEQDRARTAGRRSSVGSSASSPKLTAAAEHPAGRERARAVAVGEVPGGRAGEQHPDGERQHVDARPQRRLGEAVAVLGQPDALQPDDQHEHQAAARDGGQERRQRPERERADRNSGRRNIGSCDAALDERRTRRG